MRVLATICSAAAIAAMLVAPATARADEYNKLTYFTFSGPFQIPGHTLAAGTYTFKLADGVNDRHVVQIFNKATSKLIATIMTIPDDRLEPTSKPVIMFKEMPAGTPAAVQAWFYPGNSIGDEFIYPRSQAIRIAKAIHKPVMAMADDTDTKGAIGRIDENGNASDTTSAPATTTAAPAPAAPAPAATTGSMSADATPTTTAEPVHHRRTRLPQTASPLGLYELISGLSLAGAYSIRRLRTR